MWDSLNLRKFPRLNLKCDIEILDAKHSLRFSAVTENIGAGGVCVILPREIPRLSDVNLKLYLSEPSAIISCLAKVKWVVKSQVLFQNEVRYDTGMEFLDIRPEDREKIRRVVEGQADKS